eukprot:8331657-Lingulodinium_polyedra.AAC.1
MCRAVLASEAQMRRERAVSAQVDSLLGLWTWIVVSRGGMAIPSVLYRWVREHRGRSVARLPQRARDEIAALAALS